MSRPVYTALYSLFIIVLFFSLSLVYQACGKNKKAEEPVESLADKVENVADSYTEDSFFEDDESGAGEDEETNDSNILRSEEEAPSVDNTPVPPVKSSSTISGGDYMVIAGNYLLENNADQMVKKLRSAGYNQSEKVVFDLSQYYTVIAGKFDSRSRANQASEDLNRRGIDNYVLRKKS